MSQHTYIISSIKRDGGLVIITGTVNNIPATGAITVTVTLPWDLLANVAQIPPSAIGGNTLSAEALVADAMLRKAIELGLTNPAAVSLTIVPIGTFTY